MKIFKDANKSYVDKLRKEVFKINELEPEFSNFQDDELKKYQPPDKNHAFALVRETAKRVLNERPFDVQVMAAIALDQGEIAEMKTGEGKTLASTMAIYWNALSKKGVHVVTVNDYLAQRDANWMGPIFNFLGLKIACLTQDKSYLFSPQLQPDSEEVSIEHENLKEISRKEAYQADIIYGTNNQFGFDYLRDNMALSQEQIVQRDLNYAIVDEVDSILIDEARTPLIISAPDQESSQLYQTFSQIVPRLSEKDYELDKKSRGVTLTESGMEKVTKLIGMDIYKINAVKYVHHLEQALRAELIFKKDVDYLVKDGQVIIIDQFTGRMMPERRYSGGLHQALEAKEKVMIQQESRTLATITFQNYFRLYQKLSGMTGTAMTSAEEFAKVYGLDVVGIPTNKPLIREDKADLIFKSEEGKFKKVVEEIKARNEKGQPVLVGTIAIDKNEKLSELLNKENISHRVLNAKYHEAEAPIIAQAGKKGAVTVATNMAGRGVDIKIDDEVRKLGGLAVIGTERHESRRIDNQLRGRCGRQGDSGISRFYVSLEDDLMRAFAPDRVKSMMERLKIPEDQPIEHKLISRSIEEAQKRLEGYYFDTRKHVLEYDDVLNKQREKIYHERREAFNIKDGLERAVALRTIDLLWMDHLDNMDYLRQSVNLRAYGQRDPLLEYKKESHEMFSRLQESITEGRKKMLEEVKKAQLAEKFRGIKRNDLCPCGSGKKYKKCHGR